MDLNDNQDTEVETQGLGEEAKEPSEWRFLVWTVVIVSVVCFLSAVWGYSAGEKKQQDLARQDAIARAQHECLVANGVSIDGNCVVPVERATYLTERINQLEQRLDSLSARVPVRVTNGSNFVPSVSPWWKFWITDKEGKGNTTVTCEGPKCKDTQPSVYQLFQ